MTPKVLRGLAAGLVGTAAMTGHQEIRRRLARSDDSTGNADDAECLDPWESAPAPAQVGKRLLEGALGWQAPARAIPVLTQVMHWSYGTLWGAVFAFGRDRSRSRAPVLGPLFGLGVWGMSYAQLVPLKIYEPPWRYPLSSLVDELGYHLTYGTTVALTYDLIDGGMA